MNRCLRLTTLLICIVLLFLQTGCGSVEQSGGSRESSPSTLDDPPKPYDGTIRTELERVPPPETLPPEMCFVAVQDYEIILLGKDLKRRDSCRSLASRYLPITPHLPWRATVADDPDLTNECALSRGSERLWITISATQRTLQGNTVEVAHRACEQLVADGWTSADEFNTSN
jgi:hypothetical protein